MLFISNWGFIRSKKLLGLFLDQYLHELKSYSCIRYGQKVIPQLTFLFTCDCQRQCCATMLVHIQLALRVIKAGIADLCATELLSSVTLPI